MKHFKKEILFLLIALLVVNCIVGINISHYPEGAILHIFVSLLSIVFMIIWKMWTLRNEIIELIDHQQRINEKTRKPVLKFLFHRFKDHLSYSRQLSLEGIKINEDELEDLVKASFSVCKGSYQGTDQNPPSILNKIYPTYIKEQIDRNQKIQNCDSRFLLVSKDDLYQDYLANKLEIGKFIDAHSYNGITLLQTDPKFAINQAKLFRLWTTDIGVFSWRFIVFYRPMITEAKKMHYFVRILPLSNELKVKIGMYLDALNQNSKRVEIEKGDLKISDRRNEEIVAQKERMFENNPYPPGIVRKKWKSS